MKPAGRVGEEEDYGGFVSARRESWAEATREFTALRGRSVADLPYAELDAMAARHRRMVADFAFVRARFPGTEAERELRRLVFAGHRILSPPEPPLLDRFRTFFSQRYPARFRASLPALEVALALLLGAAVFGLIVTTLREDVARLVVGEEAYSQLRGGTIWTDSLEGGQSPISLAVQIFTNNIGVALLAWAGGAAFGAGTVFVVAYNGFMLGSLAASCVRYGLLDRLLAFIPAHGLLEVFLVTVAGAAGLELAAGLLRPGEDGRGRAFSAAAVRSLELVGGTVPWFVLLGLVEGTLSPLMGIPTGLKSLVGVGLLSIFLVYVLVPGSRRAP